MRHPQISLHFCENGRKECSNDYMKPFPTLSCLKKSSIKKKCYGLIAHNPLGQTRVKNQFKELSRLQYLSLSNENKINCIIQFKGAILPNSFSYRWSCHFKYRTVLTCAPFPIFHNFTNQGSRTVLLQCDCVPYVFWRTASHDINAVYSVENIRVSSIMKLTM